MKNYIYHRTFYHFLIYFSLLFIFSCSKNLENTKSSFVNEKGEVFEHLYQQEDFIDLNVLLSLKRDTLFNEYVKLLDYSYLTHMTDSVRKSVNGQDEIHTIIQEIMRERAGDIGERFDAVKENYPKDFFRYVTYQSRLKTDVVGTKSTPLDTVHCSDAHVHGVRCYEEFASYYMEIYRAVEGLANRAYTLFYSEIKQCNISECRSYEKLLKCTFEAAYCDMGYGIEHVFDIEYLSRNFTQEITGGHVKEAVEIFGMKIIPLAEFRSELSYSIAIASCAIECNGNFKAGFLGRMNCYELHSSGGGGGGTNPPDVPCRDAKCPVCRNCLHPSKPDCVECICVCVHAKCPICNNCVIVGVEHPKCTYCRGSEKKLHLLQDSILRLCPNLKTIFMVRNKFLSVSPFYKWQSAELASVKIKTSTFGTNVYDAVPCEYDFREAGGASYAGIMIALPTALLINRNTDRLSATFLHELFHTRQTFGVEAKANTEIEAKLAKLIFAEQAGIGDNDANLDDVGFYEIIKELRSYIGNDGNIDDSHVKDFNELFKYTARALSNESSSYPYDEKITGVQSIQTLKKYL